MNPNDCPPPPLPLPCVIRLQNWNIFLLGGMGNAIYSFCIMVLPWFLYVYIVFALVVYKVNL